MSKAEWRLVIYPNGVKLIEWLDDAEADVKRRATGKEVKVVKVIFDEEGKSTNE